MMKLEKVCRLKGNDKWVELRVREHAGKVAFTAFERNPVNRTRTKYLGQDISRAWSSVCAVIDDRKKPTELEKYAQSE
ncbi:hypothetical protein YDYSG_59770 [Paenibacillus tyrfis]|uniref:hypothetical protein n=1 Tax=Paenibacillus tyrfis TaxID=1501230 RepID=UPI002490D812|nr:hypothetical protein [Paenibacillus tyrfis]GLI09944.1 hypothetical protein YDYSG_59770 [Paenibacillus tyrfis]